MITRTWYSYGLAAFCLLAVTAQAAQSAAPLPAPTKTPAQAPAPVQAPVAQAPTQAPAPVVCTQTVLVPQTTYKTMIVSEIVCKPVVRQQAVTACRLVPQTEMTTCRTAVLVPEQRTRTVSYTACRLVFEDVQRTVEVMVPHKEVRQSVRTVCKLVPTQSVQTVTTDKGGWATKSFVDCCGCTHECRVWVPNLVQEQVAVTVCKPQLFQEPYTEEVTVCRPEKRQFTQRVARPVHETVTRTIPCTVAVPKIVERQVPRTTYKPVVEQKMVNVTELVPTRVERQVRVPVCTLVPKTVACAPCCN